MSITSEPAGPVAAASKKELLRGSLIALAVAAVALLVAVLPAEYGIDPTGAGQALGLRKLHAAAAPAARPPAPVTGSTVAAPGEARGMTVASAQATPYRADQQEIVLAPGKGVEVKTRLAKGATLIYAWKTSKGELLDHDFHGEPVNAKGDEFESFILVDDVAQSRGSLVAPFTGLHGWYWKNMTGAPVTIVLQSSGFYTEIFKK